MMPTLDLNETGATTVEYALIIAGIAVVLAAAMVVFGRDFAEAFSGFRAELNY